jgi:alkaline phosphatase D
MSKNYFFLNFLILISFSINAQTEATRSSVNPLLKPFYHGVASGDPLADKVIIWTRITPEQNDFGNPITVDWEVATDTNFTNVVNSGQYTTNASRDYTIKVDVTGLQSFTYYYYRFKAYNLYSLTGRTKTATNASLDNLRIGVVSCSNYQHGYFNSYQKIVERNDLDLILHLGDYIYEYGVGGYSANLSDRQHEPINATVTLEDYRIRMSQYHLDEQQRMAHQQYPWVVVWDDHESANDAYFAGAENHDSLTEGDWMVRKQNSIKAYLEWQPIREPDVNDSTRIYRKINYGDLVNFMMLDTRLHGRDEQVGTTNTAAHNDPNRTLLGLQQYNWLTSELDNSTTKWNFLGQQVMMAPLRAFGIILNDDQWDGYAAERQAIYDHVLNNNIDNIVVLTGDIHTSWANDLPLANYNSGTGANSAGVEFVTTSVTSPGFPISAPSLIVQSSNPHNQWFNLTSKGYLVVDIDKDRVQGDWYFLSSITEKPATESFASGRRVLDGTRHFERNNFPQTVRATPLEPLAPALPSGISSSSNLKNDDLMIFASYPNPFTDRFTVQFYVEIPQEINVRLVDFNGRNVFEKNLGNVPSGLQYLELNAPEIESGNYILILQTQNSIIRRKMLKLK